LGESRKRFKAGDCTGTIPKEPWAGKVTGISDCAFDIRQHASLLDIQSSMPPRPKQPTELQIHTGSIKLSGYISELWKNVEWRLSKFLFDDKDVLLRRPLKELTTPDFEGPTGSKGWCPTAFAARWEMASCQTSLQSNGIYEALITLWQFDVAQHLFDGIDLGLELVGWKQYLACMDLWSHGRLVSSNRTANKTRYIYQGFVPTAVKSPVFIAQMIKNKTPVFKALPACGGFAQMWSLIGSLDEALVAHQKDPSNDHRIRVLRLFEASVNVPCRMRSPLCKTQLMLDQLSVQDAIRIQKVAAGAASFHTFALQVLSLPDIKESMTKEKGMTGKDMVTRLNAAGVRWHGKEIDANIAYAIKGVADITAKKECSDAVQFLERVSGAVMESAVKVARVFQTLNKVPPDEKLDHAIALMESIAVQILSGLDPDTFTIQHLVGASSRHTGYIHGIIQTMRFIKWFMDDLMQRALSDNCTTVSVQGVNKINVECISYRKLWTAFAPHRTNDGTTECNTFADDTTAKFDIWKDKLELDGDREAAKLIYKAMTFQFHDEFLLIAASGTTMLKYFSEDRESDVKDTEGRTLRGAMRIYRAAIKSAPVAATSATIAVKGGAFTDDQVTALKQKVVKMRRDLVNFSVVDFGSKNVWQKNGGAHKVLAQSSFKKSCGPPGKQNSLLLFNADVFPNKEMFKSKKNIKPVPMAKEVKEAAGWAVSSRLTNSMCLFADGRNHKIRRALEDIIEENQRDEHTHFRGTVLYKQPRRGDPRVPKRQVFAGLHNIEHLVGILPVPRTRMITKRRDHYSACGEKSTFSSSYSEVPSRPWKRLPRLSLEEKEKMTGVKLPTYNQQLFKHLQDGHPLFMQEWKEVELYLAWYIDYGVTHVFDLASGSGAAAMAAAILRIHYDGLAMNKAHKDWLDQILDTAMFSIVVDAKDDAESLRMKSDVSQYFNANIEEARKLLAGSKSASQGDKSDEDSGTDDEDDASDEGSD